MDEKTIEVLKEKLVNLKNCVGNICKLQAYSDRIGEIIKHIEEPVTIMVMGSFSTGKSTFINAMVGQKVVAVSANPTTAVITKLCYGVKDKLEVYFKDKTSKVFSSAEFSRLTAVNDSSEANLIHNKIDYVERQLPLEILKNITIIDSPGLNDVNEQHSVTTERFIKSADTVLWMFSILQACTSNEIVGIEGLTSRLKPIAIVNKMDLVDEEEDDPAELLANIKSLLKNKVQTVVGISAEFALQGKLEGNRDKEAIGNLIDLERAINELVLPHREKYKLNTFLDEFGTYLADVMSEAYDDYEQKSYVNFTGDEQRFFRELNSIVLAIKDYCNLEVSANNPQALFLLAVLYDFGITINKNMYNAEVLYKKSAEQNHILSQIKLMILYKKTGDLSKMIYWMTRAAKAGDADCNYWLGLCYLNGEGVTQDYVKAYELFKEASSKGSVNAIYELGMCNLSGYGTYIDKYKALRLFQKAAEYGNYDAAYILGNFYIKGELVTVDEVKAFHMYEYAAKGNLPEAEYAVAKCYLNGKGTFVNEALAIEFLKRAANSGYAEAQFELANYYFKKC